RRTRMLRSNDPLPQSVIRFSEAFERFFQTVEPRWEELDAAVNDTFCRLRTQRFYRDAARQLACRHRCARARSLCRMGSVAIKPRWRAIRGLHSMCYRQL